MLLMRKKTGFAMIEVMVTVVIITIGVSGLGALLLQSIRGTQDNAHQSQAMWIVQDHVGRMRANPDAARAGFYEITTAPNCESKPAAMCAQTYNGTSEVAATDCTPQQMATFDNWITSCGLRDATATSDGIYDNPSDFILNPLLTSTCLTACTRYNINLRWDTKVTTGGNTDTERVRQNNYSLVVEFN